MKNATLFVRFGEYLATCGSVIFLSSSFISPVGAYQETQVADQDNNWQEVKTVEVSATRDPEAISYRTLAIAFTTFDKYHSLAPGASEIMFRIAPSTPTSDSNSSGSELFIKNDNFSEKIDVGPNGVFLLSRKQEWYDDNAQLVLNKRRGTYDWLAKVKSANVPSHFLRIGDLKLECEVNMAIALKRANFAQKIALGLSSARDVCRSDKHPYGYQDGKRILSAVVHSSAGLIALPVTQAGSFFVNLGDSRWTNEMLVELVYWNEAKPETKKRFYSDNQMYIRGSMNNWDKSHALVNNGNQNFSTVISLSPGQYEFKVLSSDFASVNFGSESDKKNVYFGVPLKLDENGGNLMLTVDRPATYCFNVNVAVVDSPTIQVDPKIQE